MLRRWSAYAPTAYDVVRDFGKFDKPCSMKYSLRRQYTWRIRNEIPRLSQSPEVQYGVHESEILWIIPYHAGPSTASGC
jgi:hypothetical protein